MTGTQITLPGSLRNIFEKLFQVPITNNQNGWYLWQQALSANSDTPEFMERLNLVRSACLKLQSEIEALQGSDVRPHTKQLWATAVSRLTAVTALSKLHDRADVVRNQSNANDIAALDTLSIFYQQIRKFADVDDDDVKRFVGDIESLIEQIRGSHLQGDVRDFLLRELDELRFFLVSINLYGVDAVWEHDFALVGAVARFHEYLKQTDPALLGALLERGKAIYDWLSFAANVGGGMASIGTAGTFLLSEMISKAH